MDILASLPHRCSSFADDELLFLKNRHTSHRHEINCDSIDTWHADTGELPNAVQASRIILAGHGQALVDVNLTAWAGVSSAALTLKGALCVHALAKMLTRVGACR